MILHPTVDRWARTIVEGPLLDALTPDAAMNDLIEVGDDWNELDLLTEAAGRQCYRVVGPGRAMARTSLRPSSAAYHQHIQEVGHTSIYTHGSVTYFIRGVSRALTHELVRHRFFGFSQVSQRFVDSSELDWVVPPLALADEEYQQTHELKFAEAVRQYEDDVERFYSLLARDEDKTMRRKRAREAARAVLPNYTETQIVVSGNPRAWRDFMWQRLDEAADLEIRRLCGIVFADLKTLAPCSLQDIDLAYGER